jgi:putative hydrolase of the HAD superfamily
MMVVMIRGVLFDYGGVVAPGGRGADIAKRLCTLLGLAESAAHKVFIPLFQEFTRGRLDDAAFWQAIESAAHIEISDEQRHAWDDWWGIEPWPEMLELINQLKANNYAVGLLSNIIPPAEAMIRAKGGYGHFNFTVLSCEVGYAKPDPEIYQLALEKFSGIRPEEIVFIDDQPKCLPPAEAAGMTTILATDTAQILSELRKLNLPV